MRIKHVFAITYRYECVTRDISEWDSDEDDDGKETKTSCAFSIGFFCCLQCHSGQQLLWTTLVLCRIFPNLCILKRLLNHGFV